jgi:hypothetical protein
MQLANLGRRELALTSPRGAERVERARARIGPLHAALVERAQRAGALRADVTPVDLELVRFMVTGLADFDERLAAELAPRYVQLLLDGLRAPAPTPLPGRPPDEAQLGAALRRVRDARQARRP